MPDTWAWQYADITKEPAWLSEIEEPGSSSADGTGNSFGAGTESGTGNGASTESSTGNGAAVESGTGNANGTGNGEDTDMKDAADPTANAESATNGDTAISEAMYNLTLDGEPILSKRQVFKNFQLIVEEKSGLHVWKSAQLCGDLKPEDIPSVRNRQKNSSPNINIDTRACIGLLYRSTMP